MSEDSKDSSSEKESPGYTPAKAVAEPTAISQEVFSKEFSVLKKELQEQRSLSWQIIIGIGAAFLFTLGIIAVDMLKFHYRYSEEMTTLRDEYQAEIYELKKDIALLQQERATP